MKQHLRKTMRVMRRVMSMMLVFVMLFTSVDMTGFAAETQTQSEPQAQAEETINLHFRNTNNWAEVYAYIWDDSGNNGWPGEKMNLEEGESDFILRKSWSYDKSMNIIFNNGGNGIQTADLSLSKTELGQSNEWLFYPDEGKICSPIINGNEVTFRYIGNASNVTLNGSMPDVGWGGISMNKNGNVFTTTLTLTPGVYEYKYVVDGTWQSGDNSRVEVGKRIVLHFRNDWKWNTNSGYIHFWQKTNINGTEQEIGTSWPGYQILNNQNNYITANVYYYGGEKLNFIFNNNNGSQTDDLAIDKGRISSAQEYWVIPKSNSADCDILTSNPDEKISLNNTTLKLTINTTGKLTATVNPTSDVKSWTSSNENVVTVDENGNLKAVGVGTATITATSVGNNTANCNVTVVESISLDKTTLTLEADDECTLDATIIPSGNVMEWTSSNPAVATVDANGKVKALAAGTTRITATTVNGETATCDVTVVETITLDETRLALIVGDSKTLIATAKPASKTVTWTTSDATVAIVNNGQITAVGAGKATITASISDTVKATCEVSVSETITLPATLSLEEETEETLVAITKPENVEITWTSSDEAVATVDENGKITAKAEGTATITATTAGKDGFGSATATCLVTVTKKSEIPATDIALDILNKDLLVGDSFSLTATTTPASKHVIWESSDDEIATVVNGVVTAKKAGTVTITARVDNETVDDVTATCTVTVVEKIVLNKTSIELKVDKTETLQVTDLVPADTTVTWTSSDDTVATVENGVVTAVGKGEATITASTAGGAKAECNVTVEEDITLDKTNITLVAESTETITATPAPSTSEVTWTSSDELVATVENGVVTAVAAGTATITATTAGGATATCTVKVEEAIELSEIEISLVEGKDTTLTAIVKPSTTTITWKSSNTRIATVDEEGKVTAVAPGKVTITATTTTGKTATCEVTVTAKVCTYTIYAYTQDPNKCNMENGVLYIFDKSGSNLFTAIDDYQFTETETINGKTWLKATFESTYTKLGFIYKSKGNWNWQTADYIVDNSKKEDLTIYLELLESPVVIDNQVIFNYVNDSATAAEIRGTMNNWGADGSIKMSKQNGVFTGATTLAPGIYEYKIVYNGDQWVVDPLNPNKKQEENSDNVNSVLIVSGFANPVIDLLHKGDSITLPTSTYFVDASGNTHKDIAVTYTVAENAEYVTLDGNTLTLSDDYPAGDVKLQVSGKVNGKTVSSTITCDVSKEYKYTMYVYTDDSQKFENSELYIWDVEENENITGFYEFETEVIDEITWLKVSIRTTAKHIGFIFKEKGGQWTGWQSEDYIFQNTDKANQSLYIVDGMTDIYKDIPSFLKGEKYTYTIYAYSPVEDKVDVNNSDLWVWNTAENFGKACSFTGTETIDGRTWLKAEIKLPYKEIGFLMRAKGTWDSWKTADYTIDNTTDPTNPVVYIVDGHEEVIGDKNMGIIYDTYDIEMEEYYVYVEYVGESYNNKNLFTWGTGYSYVEENGNDHGLFISFKEREDGTYVAKIPVKVAEGETTKSIGFLVLRGQDWNTKEGGDNFYTLNTEIGYGRIRFGASKIIKDLTEVKSSVINRKNNTITFNYRDNDFLSKAGIAYLGESTNVSVCVMTEIDGVKSTLAEYPMSYDKDAQVYTYQLELTGDTDYYYYYKVNGNVVIDENCTRTQEIDGVSYSYIRNKVYNVAVTASVYRTSMDYNDNNVISIDYGPKTENDSLEGFNVEHIYLDLSAFGLGSRVEVDKELKEFTFGCSDEVAAGTKTIKVILVDDCEMEYYATVSVTVTERNKTNDFDWDEAVIYFAVTDRFFDGNTLNNTVVDDGANTTGYNKNNGSGIHGGDLAGLTAKLDYLKSLGVNTIWITPIVDNIDDAMDGNNKAYGYHGYWTENFKELNPHLGTEAELKALIDAVHAKDMKIMVDVVLNHAGYGTESYFNSQIDTGYKDGAGNIVYKPMIRTEVIEGDDEKMSLSGLPDFVTEDPEVRALLIEWQTSWMSEFDIDYYRVDTVKHVDDTTWSAFKNALTKIDPTFKLIGEYYDGGYRNDYNQLDSGRMDSILDFHFNDVMTNLASENLKAIETELMKRNELLSNTATMGNFLSSHDENGFLYDLINSHGESEDWAQALMKVAATYQITAKGQPVIYYGEELGLTGANNYPKQDNRYDFNWNIANDSNPMYVHYKKMLNIRQEYSEVFAKGNRYTAVMPEKYNYENNSVDGGYEVFARSYEGQTIYVGTNVWGDARTIELFVDGEAGSIYKDLYSGKTYTVSDSGSITISIPGAAAGGTVVVTKASEDNFVKKDNNEVTLVLHYKRSDNKYNDWNAWMWADTKGGARYDFEKVNGEMVTSITVDGRNTNSISFRIRLGDWKDNDHQAKDQTIDISDVVSGTVHYYVDSGIWGGVKVLGGDAVVEKKIVSTSYTRETNTFTIVTNSPIKGSLLDAFTIKCLTDDKNLTIVDVDANGCTYTVTVEENIAAMKEVLKTYALYFEGYEYTLAMPNIYSSKEFETAYTYDGDDLGLTYTKEASTLKVWAPTADKVVLNVYESGTKGTDDLIQSVDMTMGEKGVWEYTLEGDWNGKYYTYTVSVNNETNEVCDPYARTTGVNGNRAMILDLDSTDPEGWANDTGAHNGMEYTDAVIYELHVRDLSIDDSSGVSDANQGKFLGLTETGTTTDDGTPTALDHMIDLGVTHVHLLPIYDYASVDESKLDKPQFNWGYDPLNYNVPEGSYSTNPYDGSVRVKEMKEMVQTLHENNINVIMDVVYNHVYDAGTFGFNVIVPSYFSRTNADGSFSNGSGCGNDTATERSMVHKYVVESILYWHEEYHIDGFRFDLVGLLDTETINTIVEEVHKIDPDIIFYGEGWTLGTAVSKEGYDMATQANAYKTPNFAYFSDTLRNGVAGTDTNGQGFIWGTDVEDLMKQCFTATTWWCPEPIQTINYVSCHDNYTLMDKINVVSNAPYKTYADAPGAYQTRLNNLAASFYMLSEGIPLIHAGEEFLRTKLEEGTNTVIHNSYNASDYVNKLRWYNLDGNALYADTVDYYEGLIEFRKNHEALRLSTKAEVAANVKYYWVNNDVILFTINGKDSVEGEVSDGIVVIFNASDNSQNVNLYNYGVTNGTWKVCINADDAGTDVLATVSNGQVNVPYKSVMVLVKGATVDTESVYTANNKVTIEVADASVEASKTTTLTAVVNPANSTLVWTSADESIATVDENGKVTGIKDGTTTITVSTLHGVSATCTVTVAPRSHEMTLVEEKAPTCTEDGYKAHYYCEICGKLFVDEHGTQETTLDALREEAFNHKEGEAVEENRVEATCTKVGSYDEVIYCSKCEAELSRETKVIEAFGHKYGEATFTWASDFKTATATVACERDENHVATEDATVTETLTKEATSTEKGKITYTATVTVDGKTYTDKKQKQVELLVSEEVGNGSIDGEVVVAEDVVDVTVENFEIDNVKELFTEDEMKSIEEGAEVKIYLEVTNINDTVQDEHKEVVEAQVDKVVEEIVKEQNLSSTNDVNTDIAYFDFSLYKEMGGNSAEKLEKTGKEALIITIEIPEEMKSDNVLRDYFVIRVHGTEVTILVTTIDREKETLTFETDRFSTYAVVYTESTTVNTPPSDDDSSTDDKPSTDDEPSTDDKPSTDNKPSTDDEPSTDDKPSIDDKPSTDDEPSIDDKPSIENKPSSPLTGVQVNDIVWYQMMMLAGLTIFVMAVRDKKSKQK